jgi:tRNA pseudouridine38-40 synthase
LKFRYFIEISYHGFKYHGWQFQPKNISVQSVITKAISTILQEEIEITGCGRTDAGVHAKFFVAHFDSKTDGLQTGNIVFRLNRFLPKDIAVHKFFRVKNEAHARFDAVSRTYNYLIIRNKNPFWQGLAYHNSTFLDFEIMNQACQVLYEYSDFTSFSKLHTDVKTNICKIHFAEWKQEGDILKFTITADRFLRNMVRAIVGTMIEIGKSKISINDFRNIIEAKNRSEAGVSVPACGLYLVEIEYPEEIFADL